MSPSDPCSTAEMPPLLESGVKAEEPEEPVTLKLPTSGSEGIAIASTFSTSEYFSLEDGFSDQQSGEEERQSCSVTEVMNFRHVDVAFLAGLLPEVL